jgi:hypothetical protein
MPIVRSSHAFDQAFTQIPNSWVRDPRLSLKAKGLLAQLMSHSPGWNVTIRSIAAANHCGLDLVRSAVAELEDAGYLLRRQERLKLGQFAEVTWQTCDPEAAPEKPSSGNPTTGNPRHKNTSSKNTNEKNNERTYGDFDSFWNAYPRKAGKQAAQRAYLKAIAVAAPEVIQAGAERYAADPNRRDAYTAHAATWLNAGRWDDEPLPERELTPDEKAAKARAKADADHQRNLEEQERRRIENERIRADLEANPPERCEHDRIKVICTKCTPLTNK